MTQGSRLRFSDWNAQHTAAARHSCRALSEAEQSTVLACLHEERFQDCSPAQVYAALLDEGRFHCSIRTMYRLLERRGESRERRDQLTHPPYQKPELLATAANQLWSWDITKLCGPVKWTTYHLYVILDVFSRYVVGWMIAYRESAELAKRLIEHSCRKQLIEPGQLTIHADRGSSMKSKPVAFRIASARSKMLVSFASLSFAGTTLSITTPSWASLRPPWFTRAKRLTFWFTVRKSWMLPSRLTPNALFANRLSRPLCPLRSGSISHLRRKKLLKLSRLVSHSY